MRDQVQAQIERIRPVIRADGGDISLHDVDEATGVVIIEITGACVSCPSAGMALRAGVERILKDRIEGVTMVRQPAHDELFDSPAER